MSLRDQLQALYDQHNVLTPDLIVDVARDPEHPLHSRFQWDDGLAADSWRKAQAHELIRSVRVVYREADEKQSARTVRSWHAVRTDKGHVYEPAEKVASDPFLSRLVLADMEREWKQLRRRYEEFDEFWQMIRGDEASKAA